MAKPFEDTVFSEHEEKTGGKDSLFFSKKRETSKPEWTLNDIRIEKIISAPIWAKKILGGRFQL